MKSVVRGTACAIALVVALTGCGSNGDSTDGKGKASKPLSLEQIRAALPTDTSLSNGFVGDDAVAIDGEPARGHCAETTGATCDGLVAAGAKELATRNRNLHSKVEFTLFSFDSPKTATAVMKSLAAKQRKDIEPAPAPVKVEAGADETDAFGNDDVTAVTMRVGSVLVYVWAVDATIEEANVAAKHQVDRLKAAV
ncbi:hypothetical protein [Streptomyces sp. NPDC091371]|uniref:hypothetical protein n=1 Tax=Streptomyces sp. NPDC091371 TaxID=3155303 RepID=UPI00343A71B4